MKKYIALVLMTAIWLSGCSGRTDESEVVDPDDPLVIAAALSTTGNVRVLTTSPTLQTGAADTAGIVAIVTDDSNRVVEGQTIVFSSDGGVLQNIVDTTTDTGEASAQLNLAGDYRNRNFTVTASLGSLSSTVLVASTGTVISMSATENLIRGDTADLDIQLLAGSGQPIPNEVLTLSSAVGNSFSQNSVVTDANGAAHVAVSTTEGSDTITVIGLSGTVVNDYELTVVENIQAVVTPVRVRVISNESSIETGGNDIARITTLVTDDNNRVISGKTVDFSSTGGVLQNISSVTNEAGQATAELSLAGDFRNQQIQVKAKVDDQEGGVLVTTNGSNISVSGPAALVNGDIAELEISLTSGNDQAISNELVSIESSAGNTLSQETVTTDATGKATVTVGSTAGNDVITISALDGTVVKEHQLNVAADILSVQDSYIDPEDLDATVDYNTLDVLDPDPYVLVDYSSLDVDQPWPYRVLWESSGEPVSGGELKFSVTAGDVRLPGAAVGAGSVVVVTDNNGIATVELSSTAAGPATIAFTDAADSDPFSQSDVEFVAVDIHRVDVEASPASVATGNSSTIFGIVTDKYGNPVKDVVVEFSSEPNLRGGTLSPVAAITDSDGKARVTFTAGSIPTQQDEITIKGTATKVLEDGEVELITDTEQLTVTERELNVIIGLAGSVSEADSDTRYRKAGLVQVTDGAGRPVPDASILVTMVPTKYRYGRLIGFDTDSDGEPDVWGQHEDYTYSCVSEDKNGNRILDTVAELPGVDTNLNGVIDINEDVNANGVLDPSDPGLVDADPVNTPTVIGGQITTDSNGVGFFSMAYPQSNAWWFDVTITARVEALGVEVVSHYDTGLAVIADDVDDIKEEPPNLVSPYGDFDRLDPLNAPQCEQPADEVFVY